MPRVQPPTPVRIAAPAEAVRRAIVEHLRGRAVGPGEPDTLRIEPDPDTQPQVALIIHVAPDGDETIVSVAAVGSIDLPYFSWFFRPLVRVARRRRVGHAVASIRAALDDRPLPAEPKPVLGLPHVPFSPEQATLLATASAATAVVSFASALFGQFDGPIGDTFHVPNSTMALALALTRLGALPALVVTALADRRGRRRSILMGVIGSAIVCVASGASPWFWFLTFFQVFQRGLIIATATVAGIAVIEEAPEGARAYAASMLALAGGFGFSVSVVVLPLADLGSWGWRIPFALGGLSLLLVRGIARNLAETTRYHEVAARADVVRGRVRELADRHYKRRFVLLAAVAFLTSMFSAPSSQFMNKYLLDVRGFSNTGIALFRTVTTAVPGLVGLLLGGRLAEARGRRPVAAIALAVATATQMVFFVFGGALIWFMSAASILTASAGGIALGTLDAELFPTEVRSTSNALLTIVGVAGSGTGFLMVGALNDPIGLGRAIALTGIGALAAAAFVVPLLPESVAMRLDDVSPTRARNEPGYGPGP